MDLLGAHVWRSSGHGGIGGGEESPKLGSPPIAVASVVARVGVRNTERWIAEHDHD
jgi:hypothetical protein